MRSPPCRNSLDARHLAPDSPNCPIPHLAPGSSFGNRRKTFTSLAVVVAVCSVTLVSTPEVVLSQAESGTLTGVITLDGEPVPDVDVLVDGNREVTTDTTGSFLLEVSGGRRVRLEARHPSFGRRDTVFHIPARGRTELVWAIQSPRYNLPDLRVRVRDPALLGTGFYRRRSDDRGGYFMTRDSLDIPRYDGKPVQQVLKATPEALFRDVLTGCTVLYVDGSHITSPGLKRWALRELNHGEVAGIEVLAPGEAPLDLQQTDPTRCSVLMNWTRRRGSAASNPGPRVQ